MTFVELLYGSRARGEADELSDTDQLTISDEAGADYSWDDIRSMSEYGSLFLWHLCLEAVPLAADTAGSLKWRRVMAELPSYQRSQRDLAAFAVVLGDVDRSLRIGDTTLVFEAGVLARTIRHMAILACYLAGRPNFSRYEAVRAAASEYQVPIPDVAFARLYDAVQRPVAFDCDGVDVASWLTFAQLLAGALHVMISEQETCPDD